MLTHEVVMVLLPYTVAHPRAVVVEAGHAPVQPPDHKDHHGPSYLSQTLQCLLLIGLLTRQELQKTLGLKPSSSASSMMVLYFTSWLVRTMPGSDRHDLRKLYLEQGVVSKE